MSIRLPNVNPSDKVKWPNSNGYFAIGSPGDNSKVLFYNETPLNIDLDFLDGRTDVLHAWEARWWYINADTIDINWQIDTDSLSVTTPPINVIFITLYGPDEYIPGIYPISLVRTVGGNVTTQQSQTLDNTGNAPNSNVATVGSTGAPGNSFTMTNDGLWDIAVTIAGALVHVLKTLEPSAGGTILQLGAATYIAEILGNLQIDGTTSLDNGLIVTDGSGHLILANNTTLRAKDTNGVAQPLMYLASDNNIYFACGPNQHYTIQGYNFANNVAVFHGDTQAIEMSVLGALTQVLGNLKVGGTLNIVGASSFDNATFTTDGAGTVSMLNAKVGNGGSGSISASNSITINANLAAANIHLQILGTDVCRIDSTGVHLNTGIHLNFNNGVSGVSRWDGINFTAPTQTYPGSFTVTHNFGYVPDQVWVSPGTSANSTGSCTWGVWNWLANTCVITLGAQINGALFYKKN